MSGLQHIDETFKEMSASGRAALMPYFTLGFPTRPVSLQVVQAIARSGADLIELGIPFSDPLADGPTIQHSTQVALEQGMTVRGCLEMVAELRRAGVEKPLLLMGYTNPLLAYGLARFTEKAALAGADGLIVPDLPYEESSQLEQSCRENDLALVFLVAPNSPPQRLAQAASRSSGFLYLVTLTGITGERDRLPEDLEGFVDRVRAWAQTPLAVGFGISTPHQASLASRYADGVIVGSALINAVQGAQDPALAAAAFVSSFRQAMHEPANRISG